MTCKKLVDSRSASIGEFMNVSSFISTILRRDAEHEEASDPATIRPTIMAKSRVVHVQNTKEDFTHIPAQIINLSFQPASSSIFEVLQDDLV